MHRLILFAALLFPSLLLAQDLEVPDSIRQELQLKRCLMLDTATHAYKIRYPKGYEKGKTYPVLLALSGGNQNSAIVDYCYYAWFRSSFFDDYIVILPVADLGHNLRDYPEHKIKVLLGAIQSVEGLQDSGWLLAGTSNGGLAAFSFAATDPGRFGGIIAMPGALAEEMMPHPGWKDYRVLLAVGEDDPTWAKYSAETAKRLKGNVSLLRQCTMKGQGHILAPDFNIDEVYEQYFLPD